MNKKLLISDLQKSSTLNGHVLAPLYLTLELCFTETRKGMPQNSTEKSKESTQTQCDRCGISPACVEKLN